MLKHNFDGAELNTMSFEDELEIALMEYSDLYEEDMYDPIQYTYIMEDAYLLNLN